MFESKVVVITGAGSGIGRALAVQLAAIGARLALSDINERGLQETLEQLAPGTDARAYRVDASVRDEVFAHADEVLNDFGAVHYVINNAGATLVGSVANTDIAEYEWLLNINLYGVLYGTKAFLPSMLRQDEGCIVNISSIFGLFAYPCQSAYNMSKFAVRGLTECLWQELRGTGVRAVCVHPGGIKTNIERAGRRVKQAGGMEGVFADKAERLLVTPPEKCAAEIIDGLRKRKQRILTGHLSRTTYWLTRLLPNTYPTILRWIG
ncbi:SDR family oxidoreductase [Pseudomonas resinovorans]|uniref:SDR family oxidoreductase n=1 Tax=Metapseudomonas resinovorans TaxID=53412 RepID=A0ABT4YBI1_METRE|nr:SDR family oxidoreductase [Pseudomonas resinovorans]MDA8486262.1 SDR family oxidoreductase [Pseudomonas resinovorans]